MSLKEQIPADLKKALREKNKKELNVLRMLQSAIRNREIDSGKDLDDDSSIIEVINSEIKKRKDTVEEYRKVKREDAAREEQEEIEILMRYMPEQLDEESIRDYVIESVSKLNASGLKDLGTVMKDVMPGLKGKADGKIINKIVREELEKIENG